MEVPSSNVFSALEWDISNPDFPTLNGRLILGSGEVEVAFVGTKRMEFPWDSFLRREEGRLGRIQSESALILDSAGKKILELHKAYFPTRWTGSASDLLNELRLRLICFYPDGTRNLWYQGSSVFNHLDVDIGLNSISEVTEVRFDG